jgi:hypothetical protein
VRRRFESRPDPVHGVVRMACKLGDVAVLSHAQVAHGVAGRRSAVPLTTTATTTLADPDYEAEHASAGARECLPRAMYVAITCNMGYGCAQTDRVLATMVWNWVAIWTASQDAHALERMASTRRP